MTNEAWKTLADAINVIDALEFGQVKKLPIKIVDLETTRETLTTLKNALQKGLA